MSRPSGFALLALLALPAVAQPPGDAGSGIEISPQYVYRFEGNVDADVAGDFLEGDAEIDEGSGFGVTVSIPVGDWFEVEFLARHQESELALGGGLFGRPDVIGDLTIQHYHVGGTIAWGAGQIEPFATMSLGLARLELDLTGADDEEKLSGSLGGGVKIMMTQHVGVRLEGRWFWTNLDEGGGDDHHHCDDDFFDDDDCFEYNDSGIYQGEASVGVIFRF